MDAIDVAHRLALAAVLAGLGFCADPADVITAIKEYQQSLGLKPTENFRKHTTKAVAEYRCYYTGKLELPASYEALRIKDGSEKGCPVDGSKYDVFYYPVEAVASGDAPVTAKLSESGSERLFMVVVHEDFHQHHEKSKLPAAATEAASTLMAFITASGFASERRQDGHAPAAQLARDADIFLAKARIVNRYYELMAALYQQVKARRIGNDDALQEKQRLFHGLEMECRALSQKPASFSSCPGAMNNAGLAFDYTYSKHYPLVYELFEAERRDLRATLGSMQEILAMPLRSEEEFIAAVRARTSETSRHR